VWRERNRPIVRGTINFCWFFFKWGLLLLVVAALIAVPILLRQVDGEIRRQVIKRFSDHYENFTVNVRSAELVEDEGIRVHGLSLTERRADGPLAEAVYIDEIFLDCKTDLQTLVSGDLDAKQMTVRRPTLRATRRPDGSWSIEQLFPLPKFSDAKPTIQIEDATIELFDPLKHPSSTYTLRDVNLTMRGATNVAEMADHPEATVVEGSLSGDYLEGVKLRGWYDMQTKEWQVRGTADAIQVSPELRETLPEMAARPMRLLAGLRGRLAVNFQAESGTSSAQPVVFRVDSRLSQGRIDDSRLPYPLTDITAETEFRNDGITLRKLTARSGRTTVEAHGDRRGYAKDSPASFEGTVSRLVLDHHLKRVLPESHKKTWDKFLPAGEIDAHVRLDFDGQTWSPQLRVACNDVSFTHDKFAYRLERGRGNIEMKYGTLTVQMTAMGSGRPVKIAGSFRDPGPHAVGRLDMSTQAMPINEKLLRALPGKSRDVVRSLGAQGTVNMSARLERQNANERWQRTSRVELNNISVRYAKFPYLVRNVRGILEEKNRQWTFRNLQGSSGAASVTCQGYLVPVEHGSELALNFEGANIGLDDQLRQSLSPKLQSLWEQFNPQGAVQMSTQLRFRTADRKLDLNIRADPVGEGVAVHPRFFPYRLENIRGPIEFSEGQVRFAKMTAKHDRTTISTAGHCQYGADGSWHVEMNNLVVDRLQLRRDLLDALPLRLRRAVGELDFNGPLNLRGAITFDGNQRTRAPVRAGWDVQLTTQGAQLDPGVRLDNVYGKVRLTGAFDGKRFASRGWLDLDTLTYRGYQLTEVRGPIWLGEDRLLLGGFPENAERSATPSRITARFYDGAVSGDGWVKFDRTSRFAMQAQLVGANMNRIADEAIPGASQFKGSLDAKIHLQGTSAGTHTLAGIGSAHLHDADIGELPLLVSLLKILSGTAPDAQAFSAAEVDFHINGAHLYFDKIDFYGDAVSLLGKGEMDFDQQVRMVFKAIVGRDKIEVPLISPLLKQASPLLLLIYVDGPLSNPNTTREPLPGVARFAEGLQREFKVPDQQPLHRQATDFFQSLVPGRR